LLPAGLPGSDSGHHGWNIWWHFHPLNQATDCPDNSASNNMPARGGPPPNLSDSEVLCLGLAAQWRSGVSWKTERGFLRYVRKHLHPMFPKLTSQSAFNRRLRRLWGGFILLQQAVAQALISVDEYEVMDAVPVPVAHGARSFHPG
jgi:hypothetical protein